MKLWLKIFIGLILGVITGAVLGPEAEILRPIGNIFLNLISMIIVPLILSSIIIGMTNIHDPKKIGRVGVKTFWVYILTTLAAVLIGIIFAKIFQPGVDLHLQLPVKSSLAEAPRLSDVFMSLVPKNPVMALVEGNILQIVVFALFLGMAINFSGESGRPLVDLFESTTNVLYQLTAIIMEFSPIGVFAIMAWVSGSFGLAVLLPLTKFLAVYYGACLIHVVVVFCSILWFFAKLSPFPFFKGMSDAIMMAFSTCSSAATLPVSMQCVQKNLGVSKEITSLVMPLGSTMNMNGAALFQGMSAIFLAQVYGLELGWQNLLAIVVASTFASIGAAGVPGAGIIMLSYVFSTVGLPLEGVALFVSIDRVREMISTVLNVLGDAVCAVYIAKGEGELDERHYYHEEIIELEGDEV